ncbi:MAG: hypothetical protein ACRERD_33560, partial [Candidatus Binatia bacterium]
MLDEPGKLGFWDQFWRLLLQPLDLWVVDRNKTSSSAHLNGYPRMSAFMASDPDYVATVYRRFDELNIRNLLLLESRVAAMEKLQKELDEEDMERYKSNPPMRIDRGLNKERAKGQLPKEGSQQVPAWPQHTQPQDEPSERFTLSTTAGSFEYFAALGTLQGERSPGTDFSAAEEGNFYPSSEHGIPRFALQRWAWTRSQAKQTIEGKE